MDQPGKVANPARGQLNRENNIPLSPCVPENLVSRDGFSRPVPRQLAHLHTQAESGAYLRDSSRVPRRRPPFMKPPYAIGSVPSLLGHAIAYRWRSLPRVRRHRASKPQGSSERVLPWQITMEQLIFASLSHPHYWYEVGMLKVPAVMMIKYLTYLLYQSKTAYRRYCMQSKWENSVLKKEKKSGGFRKSLASSISSGTKFNKHLPIKILNFNRHAPTKILYFH